MTITFLQITNLASIHTPMDELVYLISEKGIYIVLFLAILKVIIIVNYRGFNVEYISTNFFSIYSDTDMEADLKRKKFRKIHNIVTILFYLFIILWAAISIAVTSTDSPLN
jgi:hypothetical protein